MSKSYQAELDRHFAWFEDKLPAGPSRFLNWLRRPSSRLVRIPLALLLILGGILSFLPVLGLWMLPLGLLLFAQDASILQPPLIRMLAWVEHRWSVGEDVEHARLTSNDSSDSAFGRPGQDRCDSKDAAAGNSAPAPQIAHTFFFNESLR